MRTRDARPGVARFLAMAPGELFNLATERWGGLRQTLANGGILDVPTHVLAQEAGLHWPTTLAIQKDTPRYYMKFKGPDQIRALRGFGKKKVHCLLSLLFSCGNPADPSLALPPRPLALDGSFAHRVERFWDEIMADLAASEFRDCDIESLALRWGLRWQVRKSGVRISEVTCTSSWRQFRSSTSGVGQKKIELLAAILWRAWSETKPTGPAGPPQRAEDEAKQSINELPIGSSAETPILLAFRAAKLTKAQASILLRRYGLCGQTPMTLEEIGQEEAVTRERIRQVQSVALLKLTSNAVARQILLQSYLQQRDNVLQDLAEALGTRRVARDGSWHRALEPVPMFFAEALFDTPERWLDHEARAGRIQDITGGWWLGERFEGDLVVATNACRTALQALPAPVPIDKMMAATALSYADVTKVLEAAGATVIGGFVFEGRPSVLALRGIHALLVAHRLGRYLWTESDLYIAVQQADAWTAHSRRGLVNDLVSLPGVAVDLPGRYLVLNPKATVAFDLSGCVVGNLPGKQGNLVGETEEEPNGSTLVGRVTELFDQERLLTFEELEERYCRGRLGALSSLYPTLIAASDIVRYAPGYWGRAGLKLEDPDIKRLNNSDDLERYVQARRSGGLIEDFPFWSASMEYAWCRWAERHAARPLFCSLLAVIRPEIWPVLEALKLQWQEKSRRQALFQLPTMRMSLEKGYFQFRSIYALAHFAVARGEIGTATIPHFFGLREIDRKAPGTLGLLAVLGILEGRTDLDTPWAKGPRAEEWLATMSELFLAAPQEVEEKWALRLAAELETVPPTMDFGLFTGEDICQAVREWAQ